MAKYDDNDDDDMPVRKKELGGLDGMFANTNIVVLVLFALCCNGIALILGVVGLIACTDAKAKSNALVVTIIGGIVTALAVVGNIVSALSGVR